MSAVLLCGCAGYAMYGQVMQGRALDSQIAALKAQNAGIQQQITDHQGQIAEAQSPAWLQEQARKLGFVDSNETVYILTPGRTAGPTTGGVSAPLPSFSPSPSPTPSGATPSPSATDIRTSPASPTPYVFALKR